MTKTSKIEMCVRLVNLINIELQALIQFSSIPSL